MKKLFFLIMLFIATEGYAHGGISALAGLAELTVIAGYFVLTVSAWLIFTLVLIFSKNRRKERLKSFRGTILVLTGFGFFAMIITVFLVWEPSWEMFPIFFVLSAIMMGSTELEILIFKKHGKLNTDSGAVDRG